MDSKLKLIRGSRINQQLEIETALLTEESTLRVLDTNTRQFQPPSAKRQHATGPVNIVQVQTIPFAPSGELKVETVARSGESGKTYHPILMFQDVQYEEADTDQNVSFTGHDGKEHHIQPISLAKNNVKVRCDCLDFYYRFFPHNNADKSMYGNVPRPYVRKTNTRPPANPQKVPGLCKHLLAAAEALINTGLIIN